MLLVLDIQLKQGRVQMVVGTRYPTQRRSGANDEASSSDEAFFTEAYMAKATAGTFYFVSDDYFLDFPDQYLMRNKETVNGQQHRRPCFYAFEDANTGLLWMIPFSSQVQKYHHHANSKTQKYGRCDTILFGRVLGHEKAFLIQNMCPMTDKYLVNQYIDARTNAIVRIDGAFETVLIKTARQVLARVRKGVHLIFPDVLAIEEKLLRT